MPVPEPYFTWADVVSVAKGEKVLRELLAPSTDTSADHPVFDEHYETAVSIAEAELGRAGVQLPLPTPLQDAALRNAMIGVFLGNVTAGKSDREPWLDKLEAMGLKWLKRIGDGDLIIKGAASEDGGVSSMTTAGRIGFNAPAHYSFDRDDDNAPINEVFSDLDPGPIGRRINRGWGGGM